MKIYATYGLIAALVGALLTLVLFFSGLQGEHIEMMSKWYVWLPLLVVGIAIATSAIALGMRAWRTAAPDQAMNYARGLGIGVLISLWQGVGSAVFQVLYVTVINPDYSDLLVANQVRQMEEKGVPAQAIEMGEKFARFFSSAPILAVFTLIGTVFFGFLISLIVAAIMKRSPAAEIAEPAPVPPSA